MVLAPFGVALRHSKKTGAADHTRLFVPEVHVVMSSSDFQTLNDIIELTGTAEVGTLVQPSSVLRLQQMQTHPGHVPCLGIRSHAYCSTAIRLMHVARHVHGAGRAW